LEYGAAATPDGPSAVSAVKVASASAPASYMPQDCPHICPIRDHHVDMRLRSIARRPLRPPLLESLGSDRRSRAEPERRGGGRRKGMTGVATVRQPTLSIDSCVTPTMSRPPRAVDRAAADRRSLCPTWYLHKPYQLLPAAYCRADCTEPGWLAYATPVKRAANDHCRERRHCAAAVGLRSVDVACIRASRRRSLGYDGDRRGARELLETQAAEASFGTGVCESLGGLHHGRVAAAPRAVWNGAKTGEPNLGIIPLRPSEQDINVCCRSHARVGHDDARIDVRCRLLNGMIQRCNPLLELVYAGTPAIILELPYRPKSSSPRAEASRRARVRGT
jgi:hypothetical protein